MTRIVNHPAHPPTSPHQFRQAAAQDLPSVIALVNQAYAPAEAFLYDGPRIEMAEARELFARGHFLLETAPDGALRGSVYVQIGGGHGSGAHGSSERGYFGLLAVLPSHQGLGIARALITAAESFCRARGCRIMELTVVNHRTALLAFYGKAGYQITGQQPFEASRLKLPSHMIVMRKDLV